MAKGEAVLPRILTALSNIEAILLSEDIVEISGWFSGALIHFSLINQRSDFQEDHGRVAALTASHPEDENGGNVMQTVDIPPARNGRSTMPTHNTPPVRQDADAGQITPSQQQTEENGGNPIDDTPAQQNSDAGTNRTYTSDPAPTVADNLQTDGRFSPSLVTHPSRPSKKRQRSASRNVIDLEQSIGGTLYEISDLSNIKVWL
jgi:hypothetical protein